MSTITKVSTVLILIITIPICFVYGQDSDNSHSLQRGSKALQFEISNNFTLSSFTGSVISYKYHVSDNQARRIGLSLNNSYIERDLPESETEYKNDQLDVSLGVEYTWLNYTQPDSDMKFYYGYGPRINVGYVMRDQVFGERSTDMKRNMLGVAGIGYAGVEWFFKSSMSLHAEYRMSAQVNYYSERNRIEIEGEGTDSSKNTITTFTLNGDGVRFGLSVYF
ncbi:MAG: hypothetical protein LAT57_05760 [Balneolales bacterium]|nr:hypothetical protein [Balneolales bacterium]